MRKAKFQLLSPGERRDYGVIVTADVDGHRHVVTEYGKAMDALKDCIARLEAMGDELVVVSISTPNTIYSDLKGREHSEEQTKTWNAPEPRMLTMIGRVDLVPEPHSRSGQREWRRRRLEAES